jgi:hypothetical protein
MGALRASQVTRLRRWKTPRRRSKACTRGSEKCSASSRGYKAAQLEGSETREITIKIPNSEFKFSGLDYVTQWAMPNFYFHATMAYAILRHNGIELGKKDFLIG